MNFAALDRPSQNIRIRLESTAVRVQHEGSAASAGNVLITYWRQGHLHRIRAKAAILSTGGWVSKNIVGDLPEEYAQAYRQFHYGPIMTANVAIRNWRFFDKLGFTVARWFEGLGWHVCIRRNVRLDQHARPLTPGDPIVLTFYIPFLNPGADPVAQGSAGRALLLATSYADFERQIRQQMSALFASGGFDWRRDVAGVVLNRWGHAYFAPPVGFFFGSDGRPPAGEVLRKPHGRIIFAHSELQGNMNMAHAMLEGRRGALQALELL
jgi:spermidine dehydrogenase